MKVGADVATDQRRLALIRSIIDDPKECAGRPVPSAGSLVGKQAGPTGSVLMIDSNQVWDVQEAVDYVKQLKDARPWFIEEVRPGVHFVRLSVRDLTLARFPPTYRHGHTAHRTCAPASRPAPFETVPV